jgi:hypothetical protein
MTVEQFLQMNESSIGTAGASWDSCDALLMFNKARSALYGIDNWSGLIDKICVPCGEKIFIPWFSSRAVGAYECKGIIPIATGEYWAGASGNCCGGKLGIIDLNEVSPVPVSNNFSTRIGIRITDIEDANSEVKFTYQNHAGAIVTETLSSSDFNHFSVTESKVKKVISIKKPDTHGFIQFYSSNSDGQCCTMLFQAHPMEQHLQYRAYCIPECCNCDKKVILDVKKTYIPFTEKHYNLPIDFAEHALSLAMEAIAAKDTRTPEGRATYKDEILLAINYLRKNEVKEKQSYGDGGQSNDYPSFIA